MESKLANAPEILCYNLPEEFIKLLKYARKLEFEEDPDYKTIKLIFKNHIMKKGEILNVEFVWNKSREQENKEEEEEDEDGKKYIIFFIIFYFYSFNLFNINIYF